MKPLAGLLVVSLEQAVAAPLCAAKLADAGARVIKIERAEGDFARHYDRHVNGLCTYFVWMNRGKESIVLDLKNPGDATLLHRIVAKADVFIQNLAPGAAARAGFGSADLRACHSRLITCDISGYGETGPYSEMKAYDLLIQAESGLAAVTGAPEAAGRVGISVCDLATGLSAYAAVLEALIARGETGKGSGIAISLYDVMADWMSVPLLQTLYAGAGPKRVGMSHPSIAPYGAFPTQGEPIVIAVQSDREWQAFARTVLERPDLAEHADYHDNTARVANRETLDSMVGAVFISIPRGALIERLNKAGTAYGALNSIEAASRHPQLRRTTVASPNGPLDLVAPPVRWAGASGPPLGPVPGLDEHGPAIRQEFA